VAYNAIEMKHKESHQKKSQGSSTHVSLPSQGNDSQYQESQLNEIKQQQI
jgi:hypothetical protein